MNKIERLTRVIHDLTGQQALKVAPKESALFSLVEGCIDDRVLAQPCLLAAQQVFMEEFGNFEKARRQHKASRHHFKKALLVFKAYNHGMNLIGRLAA